jgi:hypothetical protein
MPDLGRDIEQKLRQNFQVSGTSSVIPQLLASADAIRRACGSARIGRRGQKMGKSPMNRTERGPQMMSARRGPALLRRSITGT